MRALLEKLQAKLEIRRLESRYVKRTKRSTWVSDARYVNGEYVFAGSPKSTTTTAVTSSPTEKRSPAGGRSCGMTSPRRFRPADEKAAQGTECHRKSWSCRSVMDVVAGVGGKR